MILVFFLCLICNRKKNILFSIRFLYFIRYRIFVQKETSKFQENDGSNRKFHEKLSFCLNSAGFGGPRCGKQCKNHGPSSSLISKVNGKHSSIDLCPVLCEFDLGKGYSLNSWSNYISKKTVILYYKSNDIFLQVEVDAIAVSIQDLCGHQYQ